MKRITLLILLIILLIPILFNYAKIKAYADRWINFSFCDETILFKVGTVDPRFNITKEQVVNDSLQAAEIWNQMAQKELFKLAPEAELEINLIFDERQQSVKNINEKQEQIDKDKEQLTYNSEEFLKKKNDIEVRLNELNKEIQTWNRKGGAPPNVYDNIKERQQELQTEIDALNAIAGNLNVNTDKVNTRIEELNDNVNNFNKLLTTKPEEGLYIGGRNRIEVYIYDEQEDFVHTVAHELGHALGLDHVTEANSILYPISSPDSHTTSADVEALNNYCVQQNRLELIKNDLKNVLMILFSQFQNVLT